MTRVVHGSSRSSAAFRTREEVGKATAFFIYPTFSSLSLPYLERRCLCIQIPITRSTSFGSSLAFFLASLRERVALTSPTLSLSLWARTSLLFLHQCVPPVAQYEHAGGGEQPHQTLA